jgi:subtilisin family serine protease
MDPFELVRLSPLMKLSRGRKEVVVGLLDGPVAPAIGSFAEVRTLPLFDQRAERSGCGAGDGRCRQPTSPACRHGTSVAGLLVADRNVAAICPDCTLLIRPVFTETPGGASRPPSAMPQQVSAAVIECVEGGACLLNLSAAIAYPTTRDECDLRDALDYAAGHGSIVVAAAGNQAAVGSTTITRHPWVIPVVAYSSDGKPAKFSNLASSIGRRGLGAPGERVISISPEGEPVAGTGTSFATAFVTGAIALLWSLFPDATAGEVKRAVTIGDGRQRTSVAPPLLDALRAYHVLASTRSRPRTLAV